MSDMNGFMATITFEVGERRFHMSGYWSLFDLELMVGRRLSIDSPESFEFEGIAISTLPDGFLLYVRSPATGEVSESTEYLWAFPDWLDHMEACGHSRLDILQATGLQALELREQYRAWARAEELQHAKYLIESGMTFEEIVAHAPPLAEREEFLLLWGHMKAAGTAPKRKRGRKGKARDLWPRQRELGRLAIDLFLNLPGYNNLTEACRDACKLRPDWLPAKRWKGDREAAEFLRDALRKDFDDPAFENPFNRSVPSHWTERKAPINNPLKKSTGKK